jgi:hypothetical protein
MVVVCGLIVDRESIVVVRLLGEGRALDVEPHLACNHS